MNVLQWQPCTCAVYSTTAGRASQEQLKPHFPPLIVKYPLHDEHILSCTRSTLVSTLITGMEAITEIRIIPRVLCPASHAAAP